jgi:hypothetical protein
VEYRVAKEVLSLILLPFYFFAPFLSLSPHIGEMMGRQRLVMREDERVCKGICLSSGIHGVTVEAMRQHAFAECSKGHVYVSTPSLLLAYHALYNAGYGNRIQNRPYDCRGPAKAQGSKAKPTNQFSVAQSKQSEGQSDTKCGQQLAHRDPIKGTRHRRALYQSPNREVSFMPSVWASIYLSMFSCQGLPEKVR